MFFKKLQYHVSYMGDVSTVTHNHFTSETVLRSCINWWNTKTREWKYWLTVDDERENSAVIAGDLLVMQGGFYGNDGNSFLFNGGDKPVELRNENYAPVLVPGIIG